MMGLRKVRALGWAANVPVLMLVILELSCTRNGVSADHVAAAAAPDSEPALSLHSKTGTQPSTRPSGGYKYKTVEELWKAAEEMFAPLEKYVPFDCAAHAWIVEYLDNPNPALRDEAADIIAKAYQEIPSSLLVKYLSEEYPHNVRMAALVRTLKEEFTAEELEAGMSGESFEASMKEKWTTVINTVMAGPVCPPYFADAVRAGGMSGQWEAIRPENRLIVFRRILASGVSVLAVGSVCALLPKDQVIAELTAWYPLEPNAESRLIMLDILKEYGTRYGKEALAARVKVRPVFELAMKDYDKKNADFAKECLEKWKTTPPEEK